MYNEIHNLFIVLRFLSGHTDISWLHDIHTENVTKAASTLTDIAAKESDILAR